MSPRFWIRCYFALWLLLGLLLLPGYGVSWDEPTDRTTGLISTRYVTSQVAPAWTARQPALQNLPDFATYSDNDHGVLFELPVCLLEQLLGLHDSRAVYLWRHGCVFLVFWMGAWALYGLARARFQDWRLGLAASTLLLLSPRFFAEGFYNTKDIVFLAFFTLGVYTLVRLLQRPTPGRAALHGLATAAATDVRIMGILLLAFTLGMVALELLAAPRPDKQPGRWLRLLPVYLLVTLVAIIVGWPYLWAAPLANFQRAFASLSKFSFDADLLYFGQRVSINALPWHYIPVWVLLTTPVAYVTAALLGAGTYLAAWLRRPLAQLQPLNGRLDALFIGWLALPVLMVIVLHSVVYDGWRHLYFIYPALLLLALRGAWAVAQAARRPGWGRRLAQGAATLAAVEVLLTLGRMVAAHPQQQVYFSFLPPAVVEQQFERDYWGLSYRAGLEWVLAHDAAPRIHLDAGQRMPMMNNVAILPAAARQRLQLDPAAKDVYFLTAYRTHPEAYPDSLGAEVYVLRANGVKVLSVFQKRPW
ncbi:glycosyltransferase family 39 protein [Hymenobacter jeollabukensis]|uniref:glycosyltransferase family 39 protein n=1 Tax=Hymenobacter jeollabukensis TaxID=2025313 RepID=UPI001484F2F1|nr:glycosyltransferase family 39 protein [Hymenobacter jeollabukensis]